MKKNILLIAFTLFISFMFRLNVSAEATCKYQINTNNGYIKFDYTMGDKAGIVNGHLDSSDEKNFYNEGEEINNLAEAKEYFNKTGNCPPKAILVDPSYYGSEGGFLGACYLFGCEKDRLKVYLVDEDNVGKYVNSARDEDGYDVLNVVDQNLVNKKYTIHFEKNVDYDVGTMDSIPAVYGEYIHIPETKFKLYGYSVLGYRIYNNGKWQCVDGIYKDECKGEKDYKILRSDVMAMIEFDPSDPNVYLYAQWRVNANISSQTVNQYGLGESYCTGRGFLWVDSNGGYCNTDDLQYVTCGDSYDIPIQVPRLISYFVNILKIATPLILIVVGMITLFKALVASKEDELKKAQSSLIKKIISSVMVFFVVSIVQFVILKVADSSETGSISDCMSCFLNNDCFTTTYYKTNIGGNYYCTLVSETGREDLKSCVSFYEEQRELFND